jgi:hypothetical protein
MANDKIKVLYIAGWSRSGSTILGNILGQIDGFFHVGELRYIWERGFIENWLCGCGVRFSDCEMWKAILKGAFGGADHIDADEMLHLCKSGTRTRHIPLMLMPGGKSLLAARLSRYLANLEKLYRGIQSVTGARVIVDSSKSPIYGRVLSLIPAIDLYVVHLIRDPRGTTYSILRRTALPDTVQRMGQGATPTKAAVNWTVYNLAAELFQMYEPAKYMRIRYEDLVQSPHQTVAGIFNLMADTTTCIESVMGQVVYIDAQHSVSGNPSRFQVGNVELRLDDEWRVKMKQRHKFLVIASTWPLLIRYGYLARRAN